MDNDAKFSVATQLYMRLRRHHARAIDVMWMLRDDKYAREILDFARASHDADIRRFAERYTDLINGVVRAPPPEPRAEVRVTAARGAPVPAAESPAPRAAEQAAEQAEEERLLAARYRGSLR